MADYEAVIEPMLSQARREGSRLRLLYQLGPEFEGFTPGGAWEDAKLGLSSMQLFHGFAIVSDRSALRDAARVVGFVMPCAVRTFLNDERDKAAEWLGSLPLGAAVSHELLPTGVVVVEVNQPLRATDFDALARTVDACIETHGALQGFVIHTREFPGWENLRGMLRHVRFVRDHRNKVKKIALAADSKLARLAPHLAELFVKAEVKSFPYAALDSAISWAGKRDTPN
jgi:hypothetical protein